MCVRDGRDRSGRYKKYTVSLLLPVVTGCGLLGGVGDARVDVSVQMGPYLTQDPLD